MSRIKKSSLIIQKPFPLLKLPPEIRNRIWRYVVVVKGEIIVPGRGRQRFVKDMVPSRLRSGKDLKHHQEDDERRVSSTPLAIAFTSRQLYLEAASIYYSENTFNFWNAIYFYAETDSTLEEFTAAIGPQNASRITTAFFYTVNSPNSQYLFVLPGLKRVTIYGASRFPDPQDGNQDLIQRCPIKTYVQAHPSVVIEFLEDTWG